MYLFKRNLLKAGGSTLLVALFFLFAACSGKQESGQAQNNGAATQTPQTQQAPQDTAQMTARQQQVRQQIQQQLQQQQQANIEVSDEELHTFSDALQSVQTIYQNSQPDMIQAIKDEGMEPQRFSQIAQSRQNPQSDLNVSDEETQQFNQALESIRQIQSEVMQKQISAVKKEGMTPDRFQTILNAVRQSQDLQQRLQSMQSPQSTQ